MWTRMCTSWRKRPACRRFTTGWTLGLRPLYLARAPSAEMNFCGENLFTMAACSGRQPRAALKVSGPPDIRHS